MTDLSPAAQAVLDAYDSSPFDEDCGDRVAIAAALRAVADQVVPQEDYYENCDVIREQILEIAAELEQS